MMSRIMLDDVRKWQITKDPPRNSALTFLRKRYGASVYTAEPHLHGDWESVFVSRGYRLSDEPSSHGGLQYSQAI